MAATGKTVVVLDGGVGGLSAAHELAEHTYTDLATMEGANEAARRATNSILDSEASTTTRALVWPLEEPEFFAPMRQYDLLRFRLGLPHASLTTT